MKKWKDLLKLVWAKIRKPALNAAEKAIKKAQEKQGAIVIDDLAFIAICALCVFGGLVGGKGGLKTRCAIQQAEINIHGSSNVVTIVQGSNTVDVSGSGGVSIPVTGGGK
jgi:hypothetical protein